MVQTEEWLFQQFGIFVVLNYIYADVFILLGGHGASTAEEAEIGLIRYHPLNSFWLQPFIDKWRWP
ncbi:MAG: hypothetical protein U5K38_05780 [Woeseiaceae bacterium]|nr:hypothetical protein [Woeseiaceae bacterium]